MNECLPPIRAPTPGENLSLTIIPSARKGWRLENGKQVYEGPVYHITYPPEADMAREVATWRSIGFHAELTDVKIIIVYGYIDPKHITNLQQITGILITCKENGKLELPMPTMSDTRERALRLIQPE